MRCTSESFLKEVVFDSEEEVSIRGLRGSGGTQAVGIEGFETTCRVGGERHRDLRGGWETEDGNHNHPGPLEEGRSSD